MNVGFGGNCLCWGLLLFFFGIAGLLSTASAQRIAITFDDLPAHGPLPPKVSRLDVAKQVIEALHRANVPATYGFVNGIAVQDQPDTVAVLDAWRAAGNPLGNHTWSHMNLNQHTAAEF